jgi:drug/metabolite transporter (DMT)-like permease
MNYVFFAIIAYLLLAFVNLGDKFIVDNVLKDSKIYVFFICLLGLLVFLFAPWFLSWPGFLPLLFDLFIGFLFAIAIWLFFESLRIGETVKVSVFIGAVVPVFSIIISIIFFNEVFDLKQLFGFLFLIFGTFLISLSIDNKKEKSSKKWIITAVFSAFFYSLFFITSKIAYINQGFASSFIWIRLGAFIFVLLFLFNKDFRKNLFSKIKKKDSKTDIIKKTENKGWLVVLNQAVGSIAFIFQNYAISLGSVAIVNALQGVQYAFLLIISFILSFIYPKIIKEDFTLFSLSRKIVSIFFVFVGLYLLAF